MKIGVYNVLPERDDWYFPTCKTVGYTTNRSEDVFAKRGIPTLGYIRSSEHLLNLLEGELPELPYKLVNKTKAEEIDDFDDELMDYSKPMQRRSTQQTQEPIYQHESEVIDKPPIKTVQYKQNPASATVQRKTHADNRVLNTINSAMGAKRACTNCGRCKAACPAGIDIPTVIGAYGQHEKKEKLSEPAGPEDCIECGACTACCPEKIAVKDLIRELAMQQCKHGNHPAYVSALR